MDISISGKILRRYHSEDTMQRAKPKKLDDVTPGERKDVREFYADKKDHKVSSLKELIKELDK